MCEDERLGKPDATAIICMGWICQQALAINLYVPIQPTISRRFLLGRFGPRPARLWLSLRWWRRRRVLLLLFLLLFLVLLLLLLLPLLLLLLLLLLLMMMMLMLLLLLFPGVSLVAKCQLSLVG